MRDIREGAAGPAFRTQPGLSGEHASTVIRAGANTSTAGNVRTLQQFLQSKGYHVSVDGVRGPQTEAAMAAYHQGISPKAWNQRSVHAGAKPNSRTGSSRSNAGRAPITRTNPLGGGVGSVGAPNPQAAPGAPTTAQLTAAQQAAAMAEAEYGPQIAEVLRQQEAARTATAAQVAGLKQSYGDIGTTATNIGAQTAESDQGLIAGQNQENQNMLGLFGGAGANPGAGEAAAFADINNAFLAGNAQADQSYTKNLVPIIATQGQEAQTSAQNAGNAQIADLAGAIAQLRGQQGAAVTKYTQDLTQQEADNARQDQALALAKALAPSQIATARANATRATFEARNAPLVAAREAKQFGMSVQRYNAELAATKARTEKIKADMANNAKKLANGGIDWDDPNTRASLFNQLRPIVQAKTGTWKMHPGAAQKNLNSALAMLGLNNSPQARAIANQVLQQTVTNSHANKQWGQFNYVDGKIVKNGRRFNPKKGKK
jgi:hypothetical protein